MEKNNVSTGAGYVEHKGESYLVRAGGRIESIDEIETIVIGTRSGVPIYVRDVVGPTASASAASCVRDRPARTARTKSFLPSC
ncbi:MAG: efflux RND transporter permease subunit [Planctomycetes bacterium]|nr:efflux RND transporter permease subunit [Planctomycetota bacterium]